MVQLYNLMCRGKLHSDIVTLGISQETINTRLILKHCGLIGCFNFLFWCFSVHGYSRIINFFATNNTKSDLYLL